MSKTIKVRVPGTSANCGPGFDSIGLACSIYNDLELTLSSKEELIIEIFGEGSNYIPRDERNIIWLAIKKLLQLANAPYKGAHIKMYNNIPLARGLGSSAAAIVSGLMAANAAIGNVFDKKKLLQIATEIEGHPDNVAPALFGGITLSIENDGDAKCLSFLPPKPLKLVVAVPEFNLSTKLSRKVLPAKFSLQDAVFNVSRTAFLVGSLMQGNFENLQEALQDKIHQPYRMELIPGMAEVFDSALNNGALGAALSGAGPCLIAFVETNEEKIGQAMVETFNKHKVKSSYLILDIDTKGAYIL